MTAGLATTFLTLQESPNEAALSLLMYAIDTPTQAIYDGAFTALLRRHSSVGHDLILHRLHQLDKSHLELVRKNGYLTPKSIRDAILGSNRQICANGCRTILWFREYGMLQTLMNALYDPHCQHEDLISNTLMELLETLSHDWIANLEEQEDQRAEQQRQKILNQRQQALEVLRAGISNFNIRHRRTEPIKGLFLLADFDEPILPKILDNPRHPAFAMMANLLAKSTEKNVTRLLLATYTQPQAPKSLLAVAANRSDDEFIDKLIFLLDTQMNDTVKRNLRQIETISWIDHIVSFLSKRSEEEQITILRYLFETKISKDRLLEVIWFCLNEGQVEIRRFASGIISKFSGTKVNQLLLDHLNDSDPFVQANIILTIRHRGITDVQKRVLQFKNSPYEVVRKAIREAFSEFSFERYLRTYDMLDNEPRRTMGELILDVDSETIPLLKKEIQSPLRNSRIRALKIIDLLKIANSFQDELISMMQEEDSMFQIQILELLAQIPTAKSEERIREAIHDSNEFVANTAQRLLEE